MKEVIDIIGAFPDEKGNIQKEYQWYGTLFMYRDNRFEGVAEDYSGSIHYFLFGKKEGNQLSFSRFVVNGDPTSALEFHLNSNNHSSKYEGVCEAKCMGTKFREGSCVVGLESADLNRDVTSYEISTLRYKMNGIKDSLMAYHADLYEQFLNNGNDLSKASRAK